MAAAEKKLFRGRKVEIEYVENAILKSARDVTRKSDGETFQVVTFVLETGETADIVFPNGWAPIGFDMYYGDAYTGGWVETDEGKHLFQMQPA
ncbi:MAG: hypothetical protein KBT28_01685 [Bacteroidales bacterium]|nr:hypothetical protein [Candidatus Colimorpha merdihippi]